MDKLFDSRKKNEAADHFRTFRRNALDIARSTVSAAEFIADTAVAEGRHFARIAYEALTAKITGHTFPSQKDFSLEPLGGIGLRSDPSASVGKDPLAN